MGLSHRSPAALANRSTSACQVPVSAQHLPGPFGHRHTGHLFESKGL